MSTERNDIDIDKPFASAGEKTAVLAKIPLVEVVLPAGSTPAGERHLRMRHVAVEPGGVIAAHPHENRPTILYVLSGTILEFAADSDAAIEHVAPAVVVPNTEHWWRNAGDETVVMIGADLFDPQSDPLLG